MKAIALFGVLGVTLLSAIVTAIGAGTAPLGSSGLLHDLWSRLTVTDPNYVLIMALGAAALWVVAEVRRSKVALRIVSGLAMVALSGLFHVLVSGRLRVEITMHQYALRIIEGHLESDDSKEVTRAIRIHDQELETTGDSAVAAEALLHELGRRWN